MKDEIYYISETHRQADYFLCDLSKRFYSNNVNFKADRHRLTLETDKYSIVAVPINDTCLRRSKSHVKYFINRSGLSDKVFNQIFFFKDGTKELHSVDEILEIVR